MVRISDPDTSTGGTDGSDDGGSSGGGGGGGDGDGGGDDLPDRTQDQLDRLDDTAPEPTDPASGSDGDGGGDGGGGGIDPVPPGLNPTDEGRAGGGTSGDGGGTTGGDGEGSVDSGGDGGGVPLPPPGAQRAIGEAGAPEPGTGVGAEVTGRTERGNRLSQRLQARAGALERAVIEQDPRAQGPADVEVRWVDGQLQPFILGRAVERRFGDVEPQPGVQRAIEQAPDEIPATPQPGAQRAIDQAPDVRPPGDATFGIGTDRRLENIEAASPDVEQGASTFGIGTDERVRDIQAAQATQQLGGTTSPFAITDSDVTPASVAGDEGFGDGAFAGSPLVRLASDPAETIRGPPGEVESGLGDVAFEIRDVSRGSEEFLNVNVVDPAAGVAGDIAETVAPEPVVDTDGTDVSPEDVDPALRDTTGPFGSVIETDQDPIEEFSLADREIGGQSPESVGARTERLVDFFGRGLTGFTVGLPATGVEVGDVAAGAGEFTASEIEEEGLVEGVETSLVTGGTVAGSTAVDVAEESVRNPFKTAGLIAGGAVGSVATTPVRLASTRVPTAGGGTTAVRGVRLREPLVARPLTGRLRGRTVAGARGFRPSLGAPSIRGVDTDLTRMGGTGTAAIEPGSAFEADIIRATASDIGGDAAARFRTTEALQQQAARRPAGATDFEFETAEEAIGQARAVPGSAVEDVTQTLRDIDATVFGSAAARAQIGEFRQPRDIDIVVRDKGEATTRLGQSLEGETATVSDVFDIKTEAEVPGRAFGGEEIKFGFESMEPRELGGVRFNPVEEEAIRKAGASAFLREPGAPRGSPELDIGPEPRRPGRPDVREKDVTDTVMIAQQLGFSESGIGNFQRAFGLADAPEETGGLFGAVPTTDDVPAFAGEFARDVRGQATIGAGTRTDVDPLARQLDDIGIDTRRPRADTESPTVGTRAVDSPAPVSRGFTSPSPAAGSGGVSSPFGFGGGVEQGVPSPGDGGQPDESPLPGPGLTDVPSPGGDPGDDDIPGGGDIPDPGLGPWPYPDPDPEPEPETGPFPFPQPQPDPDPDPSPERVVRLGTDRQDTDDQEFQPILPTGQEFENPIASGAQFLFGGGGRDRNGDGGNDPTSLFIG